jgi:integrase
MPRKNSAGNWDGDPNFRWTKQINKVRWRLLCRAREPGDEDKVNTGWLGLPRSQWTKEGSRDAANAWWARNIAATQIDDPEAFAEMEELAKVVSDSTAQLGLPRGSSLTRELIDRSSEITRASPNTTLRAWRDEFLKLKKADGNRGAGRFDNLKRSIDRFVEFIGEGVSVSQVKEAKYREFFVQVKQGSHSEYYKRDRIRDVRTFIRFLWQERQIEEIRNLDSLKVKVVDPAVQHFTAEELRAILANSTGTVRLFVWLFANCGMRQKDVSSITHSMFDGKYITRKRGKTADHARAPRVSHLLWPETLQLIAEHRTVGNGSELMFLQPNGKPWVLDEGLNKNDRRRRDDNFAELWRDFAKEHPQRLPAKHIRGSAANLITGNNQLSLQVKFLGDVPSGVVLKHYVDPPQADLDKAITQLRKTILGKQKSSTA